MHTVVRSTSRDFFYFERKTRNRTPRPCHCFKKNEVYEHERGQNLPWLCPPLGPCTRMWGEALVTGGCRRMSGRGWGRASSMHRPRFSASRDCVRTLAIIDCVSPVIWLLRDNSGPPAPGIVRSSDGSCGLIENLCGRSADLTYCIAERSPSNRRRVPISIGGGVCIQIDLLSTKHYAICEADEREAQGQAT